MNAFASPPPGGPDLELRGLYASYGRNRVVHGIDLKVAKGELVSLLGPSGCGKSTTLRLIAGLEDAESGDIRVKGETMIGVPPHRRAMGVMFQDYALFPHMSIEKNVGYGLRMRGQPSERVRKRVHEMLDLVGLIDLKDRLPGALSGGQKQRVALARALAIEPAVLLLDEPFSALDRHLRLMMQTEVRRIQRATSIATIFVTHDQEEALAISDRIAVMSKGLIADIGEPHRIYNDPKTQFALDFIGGRTTVPVKVKSRQDHVATVVPFGDEAFEITVDKALEVEPSPGMSLVLALRSEQIRVSEKPMAGLQCYPAEILDRVFVGTSTHFTLKCRDTVIQTIEPSSNTQPSASANAVYACWPQGAGWLLKN